MCKVSHYTYFELVFHKFATEGFVARQLLESSHTVLELERQSGTQVGYFTVERR